MQPVALISFRGEEASRQPPDTDATALLLRLELGPADLASRGSNSRMQIHLFSRLTCLSVSIHAWIRNVMDGHDLPWMNANVIFPVFEEGNWKSSKIRVETRRCSGSFSWVDFGGRNRIEFKIYFEYYWGVILQELRSLEGG